MLLPLICAFILSLAHYYSEKIKIRYSDFKHHLVSFSSGLAVSYLLLVLLPELYRGVPNWDKFIFIFVLLGFVTLHLLDKYIYQHAEKEKLKREIKEAHSIAFFMYHFFVGILILDFYYRGILPLTLFFIPILLVTITTGISFHELHYELKENIFIRTILSLSPLLGFFLAVLINIPYILNFILIGIVGGVMLFIVLREFIPSEKKGEPIYFVYGVLIYTFIIVITWILHIY